MSIHDWAHGETDVEAAVREESVRDAELRWAEDEQLADRMGRDMPARAWCEVCGEQPGVALYGWKCSGCFEARRAEREDA